LLDEVRRLQWVKLDDVAWALRWTTELTTTDDRAVTLGSAGSNGRVGAGYGGFFWRLPAGDEVRVWTPSGEGEAAVHGSRGPWLAWSALSPETRKPYTVVISGDDEASLADPFFVRVRDYPAISSALAWSERTTLRSLARSFTAVVADGWLEDQAIFNALARARESLTQ
jgi:hypothetical protein